MAPPLTPLSAKGISVALDEDCGLLAAFTVERPGAPIRPLARVPWADDPPDCEAIRTAPHLARMSGDFFCAPFGPSDVIGGPPHGAPANGRWRLLTRETLPDGARAVWELEDTVLGARLLKEWRLIDHHPVLYQAHVFEGGTGEISLAHHALIDVARGARLSLSPRAFGETPEMDLDASDDFRSAILRYPAHFADLAQVPLRAGGTADLTRLPVAPRHEDFAMLVDQVPAPPPGTLAWATVSRPATQDAVVLVKPAALLPETMLWFSQGGRQAPPWSGRHSGVLGVEDACAYLIHGHAAAIAENPLSRAGVPTSIRLGGRLRIPYAICALDLGEGEGSDGLAVEVGPDHLLLTDAAGRRIETPFHATWFAKG